MGKGQQTHHSGGGGATNTWGRGIIVVGEGLQTHHSGGGGAGAANTS